MATPNIDYPAFPMPGGDDDKQDGMTMRAYIATKMMAALIVSDTTDGHKFSAIAKQAVAAADALLWELDY